MPINRPFQHTRRVQAHRRTTRTEAHRQLRKAIRTVQREADAAVLVSDKIALGQVLRALHLYVELEAELQELAKVKTPEAWGVVRPVSA